MEGAEGSLVSLEGSGGEGEGHRVEEAHRRSAPCGTEGRHPAQHGEQKEKRHEIDKSFRVRRMGGGVRVSGRGTMNGVGGGGAPQTVLKETLLRPLARARLRGVSPLRLALRTGPLRGTGRGRRRKKNELHALQDTGVYGNG